MIKAEREDEMEEEEIVVLSGQEIGEAIKNFIASKKGNDFFPYRIQSVSPSLEIPEKVTVRLEFIPRGSKTGEYLHQFREVS